MHYRHARKRKHRLGKYLTMTLAVLIIAMIGGVLTLVISNAINHTPGSVNVLLENRKQEIIDNYKQKYGDRWTDKLKEDYKKLVQ